MIGYKSGFDGVIGIILGVCDQATTGPSAVFVADAIKSGAGTDIVDRILGNLALDFAVGIIPLAGDVFDFMFKSNVKSLRLLREVRAWLAQRHLFGGRENPLTGRFTHEAVSATPSFRSNSGLQFFQS